MVVVMEMAVWKYRVGRRGLGAPRRFLSARLFLFSGLYSAATMVVVTV